LFCNKYFDYTGDFLSRFYSFYQILLKKEIEQRNVLADLEEIYETDGLKLFIEICENKMKNQINSYFSLFYRKFTIYEKNLTVLKRKKFIYLHKLLVLRNLFIDKSWKRFSLINKMYFYRWYRIKNSAKIINKQRINILNNFLDGFNKKDFFQNFKRIVNYSVFNILKKKILEPDQIYYIRNYCNILFRFYSIIKRLNNSFAYPIFNKILRRRYTNKNEENLSKTICLILQFQKYNYSLKILGRNFSRWRLNLKPHMIEVKKNHSKKIRNLLALKLNIFLKHKFQITKLETISKIYIYSLNKAENNIFISNILILENTYNHYLLKRLSSYLSLNELIKNRKKMIVNIHSDKIQNTQSYFNLKNYFLLWKNRGTAFKKEDKTKKTMSVVEILSFCNKIVNRYKLDFLNSVKFQVNHIHNLKFRFFCSRFNYFGYAIKNIITTEKYKFLNFLKLSKFNKNSILSKNQLSFREIPKRKSLIDKTNFYVAKLLDKFHLIFKSHFFILFKKRLTQIYFAKKSYSSIKNINFLVKSLSSNLLKSKIKKIFLTNLVNIRKYDHAPYSSKKRIDSIVLNNLSEAISRLHKDIGYKQTLVNFSKIIKSRNVKNFVKKGTIKRHLTKNDYFFIWRKSLEEEKKNLKEDIKSHEEFNQEIKLKIIEYSESISLLENKINDMTKKAETCKKCNHIISENEVFNTNNSVNLNTLKAKNLSHYEVDIIEDEIEEELENIKGIKNLESRDMLKKEETNNLNCLSVNYKDSPNKVSIGSIINHHNSMKNKSESMNNDEVIFDENLGGLEYYDYLEKTVF
jgi:hypothetical protein